MATRPIIEGRNITIAYSGRTILRNINFEVYPGEIFVIVGGSGCGKSSLLRQIIGLENPAEGEVFIDGELKDTNKMRSKKTLHNVRSYHTPSTLLGKIAKLTNCKKLVLTHLVPTKFNENKLKKTIRNDFGKDPIIGRDLLKIKI